MNTRVSWMVAGCLLALGCAGGGPTGMAEIRGTQADRHLVELRPLLPAGMENSDLWQAARYVVDTDPEWQALWTRAWALQRPVPDVPAVDFGREVVVLAAMGGRPTLGYVITIDSAAVTGGRIDVFVTERSPGGRCVLGQAYTAPAAAAALPANGRVIRFHEARVTRNCG